METNLNSSECALKISRIIAVFVIFVITGTSIGLYTSNTTQVASVDEEKTVEVEVQIADVITTSVERDLNTTSRSAGERVVEEEPKVQYISIDEIEISRDMDLTQRCGVSKEDFVELMSGLRYDTSGFFEENAEIIYDLCEEYELNEIFFCGLIAGESGFNIASNHRNKHNYISMMSGGSMIRYGSDEEGLEAAAALLHNKYLSEGGSCYYGTTLSCVQRRFCPNSSTWVGLIYGCMSKIVN